MIQPVGSDLFYVFYNEALSRYCFFFWVMAVKDEAKSFVTNKTDYLQLYLNIYHSSSYVLLVESRNAFTFFFRWKVRISIETTKKKQKLTHRNVFQKDVYNFMLVTALN